MRILITGANGFIAREIIARLATAGHEIIACVHNKLLENIPHSRVFKVDFNKATQVQDWLSHLSGIDAVINCVGVFQTVSDKTMQNIHFETPKALFSACDQLGIKKVIQISALGVDKVDVGYATTKLAADNFLQTLKVASAVVRPGVVYGKGSYGGTSLFRGLAGLPFIIPLPGKAVQLQQPVHVDDLTLIIEKALTLPGKQLLCAVGAEKLSVENLLIKLRSWLGFKKAFTIAIPNFFIKLGAVVGNFIPNSPISETGVKMMTVDNVATAQEELVLEQAVGFKPRGYTTGLNGMVSSVQDRWHARLFFLRPVLRLSIAFLWIFSGIVGLLPSAAPLSYDLLTQAGVPLDLQHCVLNTFASIDILLGLAALLNYRLLLVGFLQCSLIIFYTLFITVMLPLYWLHPFAPIAKNIPIVVAILVMMALESER
jgi:uncharacterized protein YbjT (DUF2867 family)